MACHALPVDSRAKSLDEEDIPIGSDARPPGWRERRRLARQRRDHNRRRRVYEHANARWEADNDQLHQFLHLARTFRGGTSADAPLALQLRRGERAFYVVANAALVEPRRAAGQWVGRSSGWSFRVARGVYYRVGASRGSMCLARSCRRWSITARPRSPTSG